MSTPPCPSAFSIPAMPEDVTASLSQHERDMLVKKIKHLLAVNDAVLIAHYYTDSLIQRIAEETGGRVSDSLDMAQFGYTHPASTLVVAGVYFMGETAKILSPAKRVVMPTLEATCSLDLGCPPAQFSDFCNQYPDRTVIVYANTSAAVKARADWVVTSSIALEVVAHLREKGEKLLWAPDKYLGDYIQRQTQADMVLWPGACIVHESFKSEGIRQLKALYPEAAVLVHPESPPDVIAMADAVGSTSALIHAAKTYPHAVFIVATSKGIVYQMQKVAPGKSFIVAPTAGEGATCKSCAHCPWMAMNTVKNLAAVLETLSGSTGVEDAVTSPYTIQLPASQIEKARLPLEKMINFRQSL